MNARAKEILAIWFTAAIVCLLLAFVANDAWSAPTTVSVEVWNKLNEACRGAPTDTACKARDRMTTALERQGYVLENHDVWTTQEQFRAIGSTVQFYDAQARSNPSEATSILPVMMQTLASRVPLPQLFAIWNDPDVRGVLRDRYPLGWAMMSEGMRQVAMYHAREQNPALMLDY